CCFLSSLKTLLTVTQGIPRIRINVLHRPPLAAFQPFTLWPLLGVHRGFALPITNLAAVAINRAGFLQCLGTVLLGFGLYCYAVRHVVLCSRLTARELLKATILYLPLQFLILVLGRG
ncbi:MAG TPA: hypothetical protein VH351_10125, partial [Bryobacteraceae bacterium]|nr:hypothetical protein [Bryobacteraceae bacterium]